MERQLRFYSAILLIITSLVFLRGDVGAAQGVSFSASMSPSGWSKLAMPYTGESNGTATSDSGVPSFPGTSSCYSLSAAYYYAKFQAGISASRFTSDSLSFPVGSGEVLSSSQASTLRFDAGLRLAEDDSASSSYIFVSALRNSLSFSYGSSESSGWGGAAGFRGFYTILSAGNFEFAWGAELLIGRFYKADFTSDLGFTEPHKTESLYASASISAGVCCVPWGTSLLLKASSEAVHTAYSAMLGPDRIDVSFRSVGVYAGFEIVYCGAWN